MFLGFDDDDLKQRLAPMWDRVKHAPVYPCSTEAVLFLTKGMEYRCDRDIIIRYINDKYLMQPKIDEESGDFDWMPSDIMALLVGLEQRRMWQPFSSLHDLKKTEFERAVEFSRQAGESAFTDLADFTVEDLMLRMVECDDRSAREMIFAALLEKADLDVQEAKAKEANDAASA